MTRATNDAHLHYNLSIFELCGCEVQTAEKFLRRVSVAKMQTLSSPRCPSSLVRSLAAVRSQSLATTTPPSLSSDVEKIYRALRTHHASSPSKLSSALRSLPLSLPLHHPLLLPRVLSRCGPSLSLSLPFLSLLLRHPGFVPSPSLPSSLLSLLSRSRSFSSSWSLIHLLHLRHPSLLSPDLFTLLIRRFAKSRLVPSAIQVLDEMPRLGCPPDRRVFSSLLDALSKNGAVRDAARLFEEMRRTFPPDIRNFTSLLYGWCREGKMDEAKFVLARIKDAGLDPDVVVYNTLVAGYCSLGRIEDAHGLLTEMRRAKGCEPNVITYTTLMQALCGRGRVDEAMRVFVDMRRHECLPDGITYSALIGGFARCGRIDRAFEFLDAMTKSGCRKSPNAYFPIFVALEKKEDLEQCLELMSRMSNEKCSPDLYIYNTVIRLACKLGELDQAVELWNEMEASGLSPGLDSFVIIIHGFLGQNSLIGACNYFREMVGRGLLSTPQYGLMKDLLNSLLRDEKLELAKEVWGLIVSKGGKLNVYAWTIWIHALFAKKHVKEACSYCIEMMEAGIMPQADTFAMLMKGLKKMYNRVIAAEITEKVRAMAEERNVSFKMYKRRGVVDLEEKKKRKKKMERRKGKGSRGRAGGRGHSSRRRENALGLYNEEDP